MLWIGGRRGVVLVGVNSDVREGGCGCFGKGGESFFNGDEGRGLFRA